MHIGLVSPYDVGRYGGVQDQIQILSRALEERGHHTTLVGPGVSGPRGVVLVGNVTDVPGNGSMTPVALSPGAALRTVEALRGVDVVHLHEPLMPMVSLGALLRSSRPMVGTFHADPSPAIRATYRALRPPLRRVLGRLDVATAVSPVASEALEPVVDVRLIPNAVELTAAHPSSGRNERRVAFLGRDDPRKGLATLLDVWPQVTGGVPEAELIVIGADPVRNAPPDVVFHGRVSEDRKRDLLAASGVFCAPNTGGESFGIVLVEAMAAGAAVVASALPGFEYVLDGAGVTVPPGDSDALARHLVAVLRDDDRRTKLQRAGLLRCRAFDVDNVVVAYEDAYFDAISA